MDLKETLIGIVDKIVYQNAENGFTVFTLQHARQKESTTIKGYVPKLHPGEQVTLVGSWVTHPKFGKQFEAQECTASVPTSILGIKRYLASGLIKGIGPVYADKLVDAFGADVLNVIDKQPHLLNNVPGIGPKRVERIIAGWQDQKDISHIMVFLQDKGISATYATKIYKRYGTQAIEVLTENPYRLADDIWGIGFKIADQIAQNMGFAFDSIKRITSGLLFVLGDIVSNGHLYHEIQALKDDAVKLLELEMSEDITHKLKLALHDLYNQDKIRLVSPSDGKHYVALTRYYSAERGVAQKLLQLLKYPPMNPINAQDVYSTLRVESKDGIDLNEDQQRAVMTSLQHKVSVITGGPGTGKTTIIKKMLSFLDQFHYRYRLAAPTGRAAKRINESTGRNAETLHRLLEFDVSAMNFARNEQNALPIDFLIIDEASMIDIFLAYAVVKALPLNAHVIFIGDIDQLPSVGAGNFLNDIIASGAIPCVRLTEIFRQAQDSLIIQNAHRINRGEFPTSFLPDTRRDFVFIKEEEPEKVPMHLEDILKNKLPRFGIKPERSIVLVPMNRGAVGTQKLNDDLQRILNPEETQKKVMVHGSTFKAGDRVMQIRNNYDKLIFNGDIGTIEEVDVEERQLKVNFFDRILEYESTELDELVLAYAITIHKSQGSEYDAAIVPIFMQHFTLLQRNLLYTAITRAKKLCIFIGQSKAIGMAVRNNKSVVRTTFLQQFLTTDLQCR